MKGADLAAVQRIMRHQDPRITTEVYGHLQTTYLKSQIERLSFGPEPADPSGVRPQTADEQQSRLAARGASESPLPADTHAPLRLATPFVTHLVPTPPIAHPPPIRRRRTGKDSRGFRLSGREDLNLRPFGPEPNALPGCATPRFV